MGMSKNNIVVASTVALGAAGVLGGCSSVTPKPDGVFKDEIIKATSVVGYDGDEYHVIQWLSHGDSASKEALIGNSKVPKEGVYYLASGTLADLKGYTAKSGLTFFDLNEITKEQANSMRKTVTWQEAVDASKNVSAGKDSGLVK
jgi:hypothetical protein